jgi:hypothetical protein
MLNTIASSSDLEQQTSLGDQETQRKGLLPNARRGTFSLHFRLPQLVQTRQSCETSENEQLAMPH